MSEITRRCLEVLAEYRNPVAIVTKSYLVSRDVDILQELAERAGGAVSDRGFDHEIPVLARSGAGADLTQMLSGNPGSARGAIYDNSEQFRYYARWRYHLERHLRAAAGGG